MDLAGPGEVILDPQGRMDQGQQFGLSLDGTDDCQPQHRLTGGVFGAVSKDDADNRDQQSHRNILYSISSCYASFCKLSNELFSSHN